jgi:rhodanese-related sulfurtransferase
MQQLIEFITNHIILFSALVDVRPIADFNNGHIVGAINIPTTALKNQIKQVAKYKGRPIIVVCRSGAQSSAACKVLQDGGIEPVYNLRGGMLAWQSDGLPVSKK